MTSSGSGLPVASGDPAPGEVRRVFSQAYDSVHQRGLAGVPSPRDLPLAHPLLARLRLDVILSGQVVLTDAQVLDGPWLAHADPGLLVDSLQVPSMGQPFVVRSRAANLADAAAALLGDEDGRVKAFEFSTLPEPHRTAVADALVRERTAGTPAPGSADEALALLARCGAPDEHLDALRAAWSRWAAAERAGIVAVERFHLGRSPGARDDAAADLRAERDLLAVDDGLVDPVVERFIAGASRTELYAEAGADRGSGSDANAVARGVVDRLFGHLFKRQHAAIDFDDVTRLPLRPTEELRRGARGGETLRGLARTGWTDVELQSDFLVRLAVVDRAALQEWHVHMRSQLVRWRLEGRGLDRALQDLERGVLAQVPAARLAALAGLPFEALSRSQALARQLAPGRELALHEAVTAVTPHLPLLGNLTRIQFAASTARRVAGRRSSNWYILSSDLAVGRRWRDER